MTACSKLILTKMTLTTLTRWRVSRIYQLPNGGTKEVPFLPLGNLGEEGDGIFYGWDVGDDH